MNYLFRTDSSHQIGSGHVMRCLAVALELQSHGHDVRFACRNLPGNNIDALEAAGLRVEMLVQGDPSDHSSDGSYDVWLEGNDRDDANATIELVRKFAGRITLIVDHYALDQQWESTVRPYVQSLCVMDDLANRKHDCDLLIDYNYYTDLVNRYWGLLPPESTKLLGPLFAPLRSQFHDLCPRIRTEVRRVLVFFGGIDRFDLTSKTLYAIDSSTSSCPRTVEVDVVMGSRSPNRSVVAELCKSMGYTYHENVNNMARLMLQADLSIGAGGFTSYERIACGLPTIALAVADNQIQSVHDLNENGLLFAVQSEREIEPSIAAFLQKSDKLRAISQRCSEFRLGYGATRLANQLLLRHRALVQGDRTRIWRWRNQSNVRTFFRRTERITKQDHDNWFDNVLRDPHRVYRVFEYGGNPCGLAYFSDINQGCCEWGFYLAERGLAPKLGECLARSALEYALNSLKMQQIRAEVRDFNDASLHIHLLLGFVETERRDGSIFFSYDASRSDV